MHYIFVNLVVFINERCKYLRTVIDILNVKVSRYLFFMFLRVRVLLALSLNKRALFIPYFVVSRDRGAFYSTEHTCCSMLMMWGPKATVSFGSTYLFRASCGRS